MADETLRTKWTRLVEWVLRSTDQIDTRALYPATIQKSDGNRADVKPDDERLGLQLSNRPVRRPDGFTAVPKPGMRCLIGWDGYMEDQSFILLGFDGNGAVDSITLDSPITTATHDLASEHEMGKSAGELQATMLSSTTLNSITGDDTSFTLDFRVPNMATLAPGQPIAQVMFGRAFNSPVRVVITGQGSWSTAGAVGFTYTIIGSQQVVISYQGQNPINGVADLKLTCFVRGSI